MEHLEIVTLDFHSIVFSPISLNANFSVFGGKEWSTVKTPASGAMCMFLDVFGVILIWQPFT